MTLRALTVSILLVALAAATAVSAQNTSPGVEPLPHQVQLVAGVADNFMRKILRHGSAAMVPRAIVNGADGRPTQLTFGDEGYIDYFGRPWAQNWPRDCTA
jgi:hypothetical protein